MVGVGVRRLGGQSAAERRDDSGGCALREAGREGAGAPAREHRGRGHHARWAVRGRLFFDLQVVRTELFVANFFAKKHHGHVAHLRGRHSQSRESPIDHRPSHMRGSDARRQPHATASGYGAASTARGGDDTPADAENVAVDMKNDDRWTKQLCASTATRVLLAMALFGIIGTLLPVFAMRLGVRLPQVSSDRPRRTRAFTSVGLGDRHRGGVIKGKGGEKRRRSHQSRGSGPTAGRRRSSARRSSRARDRTRRRRRGGTGAEAAPGTRPTPVTTRCVPTHTSTPFTRDQMPVRALLPKS